jgi:hydroxymethylglutaryl-CoA reductase
MSDQNSKKFYQLTLEERHAWLAQTGRLSLEEVQVLGGLGGLNPEQADHMVENAIGVFGLPVGIAHNFQINGREVLVPMAIEGGSLHKPLPQR